MRPDAQWCGQCYADFRPPVPSQPAAAPPTTPAPTASYGVPALDPLTAPLSVLATSLAGPQTPAEAPAADVRAVPRTAEPTWPCTRCDAVNPLSATACVTCGSGFLAAVKDDEKPLLELPLVGDLGRMSRGRRLGLAVAVVLALLAPLAGLTLLMTPDPVHKPDKAPGTTVTTDTTH